MALEKLDHCMAAHVCPRTGLHLLFSKEVALEEAKLAELLKPFKIKISELQRIEKLPY